MKDSMEKKTVDREELSRTFAICTCIGIMLCMGLVMLLGG